MKVWLKDLHKIIADAKKLGVSGKGAMVKIYPDVNGDTQVAVYTDKAEYITDIETAYWEKDDNERYLTYLENIPNVSGELEFTKDTLKVVGDIQIDCTYRAYPRLQLEPPADIVLNDLAKSTVAELDVIVDNEDLKAMIGLADTKNYIVIGEDFMGCSPTPGYGGFVLKTESNKGICEPICISKNGAKVLSKTNLIPQPLTVCNRTYGQIGLKIDNLVYRYMERLRDTTDRDKNLFNTEMIIKNTNVVKNEILGFRPTCQRAEHDHSLPTKQVSEKHNPTFRLPLDFIEILLKLKCVYGDKIRFKGARGFKEIEVTTLGVTYNITLDEELNKDLDMWLTLKFLQQYLKPMKKCGGSITYNHTNYLAKFTYDSNPKLQAGLLGVRPPQGSR